MGPLSANDNDKRERERKRSFFRLYDSSLKEILSKCLILTCPVLWEAVNERERERERDECKSEHEEGTYRTM